MHRLLLPALLATLLPSAASAQSGERVEVTAAAQRERAR